MPRAVLIYNSTQGRLPVVQNNRRRIGQFTEEIYEFQAELHSKSRSLSAKERLRLKVKQILGK